MVSVRVPGFEPARNGFHFANAFAHSPIRRFQRGPPGGFAAPRSARSARSGRGAVGTFPFVRPPL